MWAHWVRRHRVQTCEVRHLSQTVDIDKKPDSPATGVNNDPLGALRKMSIRAVIEGAGLTLRACAETLGVSHELFNEWADGKREVPPAYVQVLSAVLGTAPEALTSKISSRKAEPAAIWFKLKGQNFTDADRESILAIRRLGHNANQLERAVDGQLNRAWEILFEQVLKSVNLQESPQAQGRAAAIAFRSLTQFGSGGTGSCEYLRGALRSKGILLIESPISKSHMEGCSFWVGDSEAQRPCLFVNTFSTTWFRRNVVIMHELGHAIFDQNSGVEIDSIDTEESKSSQRGSLTEVRAEAFARECLLPKTLVLSFCSQNGVKPNSLTREALAGLIAFSGVEQKTAVELLREYELIDDALQSEYLGWSIWQDLMRLTDHALSTSEYIEKRGKQIEGLWSDMRRTTLSSRKLLLPIAYVTSVVRAVQSFKISMSRAADLLMIEPEMFQSRFAELVSEANE